MNTARERNNSILHDASHFAAFCVCLVLAMTTIGAEKTNAQVLRDSVSELEGIDVIEHLGDTIPMDFSFVDSHGDSVSLGQYFHQEKPVIVTLSYSNCPMLCTVVLNGLSNGVRQLAWKPGEEFQMVNVSIDPNETIGQSRGKQIRYTEALGKPEIEDGWAFLIGSEDQSKALADALGFEYYYDEDLKQFAHPAVVFVLTEDGIVSRYLYGLEYREQDLRLALLEASKGNIGSTVDRIILYCFHYDPDSKDYVVFAGNVMRLAGVVTVIVLGLFLGTYWLRERRRRHKSHDPHPVSA